MQGPYLRKYNVQTTLNFQLFEVDGVDFRVDAVDAGSDCSIMKDEGAETTCTNDFVDEGTGYSLVLTATEMQAARIVVYVVDSATKVWLDTGIVVETYGNASAMHAFDLDTALQNVNATQISGDSGAADNLELFFDGTGYNAANSTVGTVTLVTTTTTNTDMRGTDSAATAAALSTHDGKLDTAQADLDTITGTGGVLIGTDVMDRSGTLDVNTKTMSDIDFTATQKTYGDGNWATATSVTVSDKTGFKLASDGLDLQTTWTVDITGTITTVTTATNVTTVSANGITATSMAADSINAAALKADALTAISFDVWEELLTGGTHNVNTSAGKRLRQLQENLSYEGGAVWVDTINGTAGTENFENGTLGNPSDNIADARTIADSLGLNIFEIAPTSSITLAQEFDSMILRGRHWTLALGGQSISDTSIIGADVTGISTGANQPHFFDCELGAVTLPPSHLHQCGIGKDDGTFTAGSAGEFVFIYCYSLVAGSGTPDFDFSGLGSATGINNRDWGGGSSYTLDSDCTLSHEVLAGGNQTFITGGADVELRGICQSVTLTLSGAGTVQFVGITGPITISGTATTTVNLFGVSSSLSDTSSGTTVTEDLSNVNVHAMTTDVVNAAALATDAVTEIVNGLKNSTGDWTKGGTSTFAALINIISAGIAGDSASAAGTVTIKDIDDDSSVFTFTHSTSGTIKDVTIT